MFDSSMKDASQKNNFMHPQEAEMLHSKEEDEKKMRELCEMSSDTSEELFSRIFDTALEQDEHHHDENNEIKVPENKLNPLLV